MCAATLVSGAASNFLGGRRARTLSEEPQERLENASGTSGLVWSKHAKSDAANVLPPNVANDLWAIHDLVAIGHSAVFMRPDSAGKKEVQDAAISLARLLPKLHPEAACRTAIEQELKGAAGKSDAYLAAKVAEVSWSCLPSKLSTTSFDSSFVVDDSPSNDTKEWNLALEAKMPHPNADVALRDCAGSAWPRACSYWVSLHRMAFAADAQGLSKEYVNSIVPVLAGGALLCHGCTSHFRLLLAPLLSEALVSDVGRMF